MVLCRKFRPERLQFHHPGCGSAAAATTTAVTCAQAARLEATMPHQPQQHQQQPQQAPDFVDISGGFVNFAAAYPQYCESRCVGGGCDPSAHHQHPQHPQMLVEPNYALNPGPTRLLPFLYVGSQSDACDAEVMRRYGVTHVLNVSANCLQSQHVPEANFMRIPVNDGYADKLLPHFQRAFQFLDNVRQSNGRCLVHCLAGVSRSPTLAIAYIMQHMRISQDEAYRYVRSRRPSVSPNFNFLGQLLEFERQLSLGPASASASSATSGKRCSSDETPVSTDSDPDSNDSAGYSHPTCPEIKRQRRRFRLSLPGVGGAGVPGSNPTAALYRLNFVQKQQQQQQRCSSADSAVVKQQLPCLASCAASRSGGDDTTSASNNNGKSSKNNSNNNNAPEEDVATSLTEVIACSS